MNDNSKTVIVMISSTVRDLPNHREQVLEACLRLEMLPKMMEHLPAEDRDAVNVSLAMVDKADVYVGIIAHRYGFVPPGDDRSITELEFERAKRRGIPRLIFLPHEDHPFTRADFDFGEKAEKLEAFKHRLQDEAGIVACFFKSPEDLRGLVLDSLRRLRQPNIAQIHHVADIPPPPAAYVAHPYTLLGSEKLVGRRAELERLTDWITASTPEMASVRVYCMVAIGGMGKSALTWTWFSEIAPQEMKTIEGQLWWSFYESDATFENFVIRALAYVKKTPREDVALLPVGEREQQLLDFLNHHSYLICLDGLERIMVAYARPDAARMPDDNLDTEAENYIAAIPYTPSYAVESRTSKKRLRKTADPRAGVFLARLARLDKSRILISSRLIPNELQGPTGFEVPGCKTDFLEGLPDAEALELWRSFGCAGSREDLIPLFRSFENYPLLIRTLAGLVARFRPAPGDFTAWRQANPNFDPFQIPLIQRKSHVLAFALAGIGARARQILFTLAAFRMPATYSALAGILAGAGGVMESDVDLDHALTELEDRGLMGWDRQANRYDLHPVVRGVVWSSLGKTGRDIIMENLRHHFHKATAATAQAKTIEELAPRIEHYHSLIALGRYAEAYDIYESEMDNLVLVQFNHFGLGASLLEPFFPHGLCQPPLLDWEKAGQKATWKLAYCYGGMGLSAQAVDAWTRIPVEELDAHSRSTRSNNIAASLINMGRLSHAYTELSKKNHHISLNRAINHSRLGIIESISGNIEVADSYLEYAIKLFYKNIFHVWQAAEAMPITTNFDHAISQGRWDEARRFSQLSVAFASRYEFGSSRIEAMRLTGIIARMDGDCARAMTLFHEALSRAREICAVCYELSLLVEIAKTNREQDYLPYARDTLEEALALAKACSARLDHADICLLLSDIEIGEGNTEEAIRSASIAYQLAWCDGPPYTYASALAKAEARLTSLGAEMPPLPQSDLYDGGER